MDILLLPLGGIHMIRHHRQHRHRHKVRKDTLRYRVGRGILRHRVRNRIPRSRIRMHTPPNHNHHNNRPHSILPRRASMGCRHRYNQNRVNRAIEVPRLLHPRRRRDKDKDKDKGDMDIDRISLD